MRFVETSGSVLFYLVDGYALSKSKQIESTLRSSSQRFAEKLIDYVRSVQRLQSNNANVDASSNGGFFFEVCIVFYTTSSPSTYDSRTKTKKMERENVTNKEPNVASSYLASKVTFTFLLFALISTLSILTIKQRSLIN